ncbi:taste receptor type 2 member 40-like [Microcaecilia unicolor]|uniref:Taste receptor type 2 n=1 Tax=Microcaecilia unicolor TaxID=1415580 RepID=A0A6P7X630_9AMPH|nr:taste receptor type 2 member 40-like [Microcaecilia unicolor]
MLPIQIASLIIIAVFTLLGNVFNAFIVVVNGIGWVKTRHLNSSAIILSALGIARFFLQWAITMERISTVYTLQFFIAFYTIWTFLDFVNVWFAALLCVLYCTKIANFSHPLFILLKLKFPGVVPWFLLGSLLISLVTSIPTAWVFIKYHNSTTNLSSNSMIYFSIAEDLPKKQSNSTEVIPIYAAYMISILFLGYTPPLFIMCVALHLLIRFLCGHTWKMKDNATGYCNPRLEVYFTTIKVMVSFLILSVLNFIGIIWGISDLFAKENSWSYITSVVNAAYLSLHSVILILSNSKLRQILVRIFHHAKIVSRGDIT